MAKMKKRKLCWKTSGSSQVVGYKLYWSEGSIPGYDSNFEMLGNVSEIILPDDVASFEPKSGPVTFGITAVDELGNESDMVTLAAPYQFSVPEAPDDLHMKSVNEFYTIQAFGKTEQPAIWKQTTTTRLNMKKLPYDSIPNEITMCRIFPQV